MAVDWRHYMSSSAIVMAQRFIKMPGPAAFSLTVASPGGGLVGARSFSTPFGTIAGFPYKRGVQVGAMYSAAAWDMTVFLGAAPALPDSLVTLGQNFFDHIIFQDGAGVEQTLVADDAGYSTGFLTNFFYGFWYWGTGSAPYWAAGDAAEVKTVRIL